MALAQPGSEFMDSWLQTDPLGGFEAIVGRLQSLNPGLRTEAGQFMSRDGRSALVLFGTSASAFDSGVHAPLLDRIGRAFDVLVSQGGEGLVLEQSSAHRFAVHAEREIRGDVIRVGLFSFVGVALLFLVILGAVRSFIIVILPPLVGILGALALSLWVFGSVDGLTIVFGISLMGVAIDYSIHVLVHHQFGQPKRDPWETRDLLRLSLFMGAVTTMASFVGLGLTPFPAFREMAFFAVAGLGCALCTTLWLLPTLLDIAPPPPKRSVTMARVLERWVEGLLANRAVLWLPVIVVVVGLPSLVRVSWSDDLSELSNLDPGLMAEDRRVRGQASSMDGSRFVIAVAPDRITAVSRNDEVARRLEGAVEEGHLDGFSSLHHVIWSPELQARNWRLLVNDSGLAERVEAAFVSRGFAPGLFVDFAEAFAADPPPPLTLEELEGTSMAEVLDRYEFPVGDRVAVVSYLRGVVSAEGIEASLEGVEGARLFDQALFMNAIYGEFRTMTLQQMLVGGILVIVILVVRYRSLRLAIAACLPALLVGPALLELFVLLGVTLNLLHVLSLILVLGMGVDYGIFLLDAAERGRGTGPTLLGLALACMTTIFVLERWFCPRTRPSIL